MENILKEVQDFVEWQELDMSQKAINKAAQLVSQGIVSDVEEAVYRMMGWSFDANDPVGMSKAIQEATSIIGDDFELDFVECEDNFLLYNVEEKSK